MPRKAPTRKPLSQRNDGRPAAHDATRDTYEVNPNHPHFVAIHEAGHAVAAVVLEVKLNSVDVKRRRMPNGRLSVGYADTGAQSLSGSLENRESEGRSALIQCLVGGFAETEINPKLWGQGGMSGDIADARRIAAMTVCEFTRRPDGVEEIASEEQQRCQGKIKDLIDSCSKAAKNLVTSYWAEIIEVANLLLVRESLAGAEVEEIVRASDESRSAPTA